MTEPECSLPTAWKLLLAKAGDTSQTTPQRDGCPSICYSNLKLKASCSSCKDGSEWRAFCMCSLQKWNAADIFMTFVIFAPKCPEMLCIHCHLLGLAYGMERKGKGAEVTGNTQGCICCTLALRSQGGPWDVRLPNEHHASSDCRCFQSTSKGLSRK